VGEHPNVELARRGFVAFATGDRATIDELIDADAVWRIRGRSDLAGEYRGREAILAMLRETAVRTGGTYRAELHYAVADDAHVVAVYRATGQRDERAIDILQALIVRVGDGRWVEVDAVPTDQYAFDEFWS
jgi:ketosteroid isomerase-like protein